ncbi:MAG: MlaD family protein [Bacteroidota bacterium]
MKISREFRAGILAIVALVLVIFGYNFLKGKNLLDQSKEFYAVYDDVEGLSPSSKVTINGHQVGSVTDISFLDHSGKLVVTISVKSDFEFSKESEIQIYGGDLIGGKSIAIVPDFTSEVTAKSGDTLNSSVEDGLLELVNNKLSPLQEKVENVVVSIDTLVNSVNNVLDEDRQQSLKSSIEEFEQTLKSLKKTSDDIDRLIVDNSDDFKETMGNFKTTSENFKNISDTISNMELKRTVTELNQTIENLNEVSGKINDGEGSLGKLVNDDKLYNNLDDASKELEALLKDMKLNPKRYVHFSIFGKKNKEYEEPKEN